MSIVHHMSLLIPKAFVEMRQVFWLSLVLERLPVPLWAVQWLNVSRAFIPLKAEVGLQLRVQLRTIPPGAERHRIPY